MPVLRLLAVAFRCPTRRFAYCGVFSVFMAATRPFDPEPQRVRLSNHERTSLIETLSTYSLPLSVSKGSDCFATPSWVGE
jgi:hypothetical protein